MWPCPSVTHEHSNRPSTWEGRQQCFHTVFLLELPGVLCGKCRFSDSTPSFQLSESKWARTPCSPQVFMGILMQAAQEDTENTISFLPMKKAGAESGQQTLSAPGATWAESLGRVHRRQLVGENVAMISCQVTNGPEERPAHGRP